MRVYSAIVFVSALYLSPVVSAEVSKLRVVSPRKFDPRQSLRLKSADWVNIDEHQQFISGTDYLIMRTPPGNKRDLLILNKAKAQFSLGRLRSNQRKSLTLVESDKKLFLEAEKQVTPLSTSAKSSRDVKAQALFLKGLVRLYVDLPAREFFDKSIGLNPNSDHAPWMSLVIAEEHFDQSRFSQALPAYQRFYKRFDTAQKELALYKMAWTFINLKAVEKAENAFTQLIRGATEESTFTKDAIRDLGYVASQSRSQTDVVMMADRIFESNTENKLKFLAAVNSFYETHGAVQMQSPVLLRILEIEKDEGKRAQFFLSGVRSSKKPYASKAHLQAFMQMGQIVNKNLVGDSAALKGELEAETQAIVKSFVDTFSGKTRTPENISKAEIGTALKGLFAFHTKLMPNSTQNAEIYKLWINVCVDLNDNECVNTVSEEVLERSDQKSLHQMAAEHQIAALDRLQIAQPQRYLPDFFSKADEFLDDYPKSKDWMRVAKRQAELWMIAKDYSHAEKRFEEIYKKEENSDNFYALQWTRFSAGQHEKLLEDSRWEDVKSTDKLVEIRRESALKLAIVARQKKDFKDYDKNITLFLSLKPDPEKARIARKDFLAFLASENKTDELQAAMLKLDSQSRSHADFDDFSNKAWSSLMQSGKFEEASELEKDATVEKNGYYRKGLSRLALGDLRLNAAYLAAENQTQALYIKNLLALLKSKAYLQFLSSSAAFKKPLKKTDRDLAVLALQISRGTLDIQRDKESSSLLGPEYAYSKTVTGNDSPLRAENNVSAMQFPDPKNSPKDNEKLLATLLESTRTNRTLLVKELSQASPLVQMRALSSTAAHEERVGQAVLNSQVPAELNQVQVKEYLGEIKKLSNEFLTQAKEFKKLEQSVVAPKTNNLTQPDQDNWFWPGTYKSRELSQFREKLNDKNYLAAMILLDLWISKSGSSKADYASMRAGVLLLSSNSPAMKHIVLAELKAGKHNKLISQWEAINEKK